MREEWDEALELEEVRRDKDGMSDVDAAKEDWEEEVITDFVRRKRPDEACFKFDISRTGYEMAQIRLVWYYLGDGEVKGGRFAAKPNC